MNMVGHYNIGKNFVSHLKVVLVKIKIKEIYKKFIICLNTGLRHSIGGSILLLALDG